MIRKILIVDDDENMLNILVRFFSIKGYACLEADSGETAWKIIQQDEVDLVISDIYMGGINGIDLMQQVKNRFPDLDFIIMTGYSAEYSYSDIINAGATDYVNKPFSTAEVFARIERIEREKRILADLKTSNEQLAHAMEKSKILTQRANAASKAKTDFLARMSHEIRTPLNGIIGYTDLLSDTRLTDEQQGFLTNTKNSCQVLLSIVNDILDFSKVEAGELVLETIDFDPEVLCFEVLEMVRSKIDETQVELACHISDAVPASVRGDPHRVRQLLLNLLGNSAKFTSKGKIELCLDAENERNNDIDLQLSVCDTGVGISRNKINELFKPFVQSDETTTRQYGGTGLGLAICRRIIEKMKGRVSVESQPGKGSRFSFKIPVKKGETTGKEVVRPAVLSGKKAFFLARDDSLIDILKHAFPREGITVDYCCISPYPPAAPGELSDDPDAGKLMSFFKKNPLKNYDIGIIDGGSRDMESTIEIGRQIRKIALSSLQARPVPLMACVLPVPGGFEQLKKEGFHGFLVKPVQKKKFFTMIAAILGNNSQESKTGEIKPITSHSMREDFKRSVSILLAEDNPVNQKMTELFLTKAGYCTETADNGLEAFNIYAGSPLKFDLIFMDINMPDMDGFEATRRIRQEEENMGVNRRVPIIALTANVLEEFENKCLKAGMDAFLAKPVKREDVFRAVKTWAVSS